MLVAWKRHILHRDGVCVIPRLVPEGIVTDFALIADLIYERLGRATDFQTDEDIVLRDNLRGWRGVWFAGLTKYLARNDSGLAGRLTATLTAIEARCLAYLPPGWRLCTERSFFRRHLADVPSYTRWHMDADAARTLDVAPEATNFWLPFDAVGKTAPSLEFVVGSHLELRGAEQIRDPTVERPLVGGRHIAPVLRPGGAAVFSHFTLHRTQQLRMRGDRRTSAELRFVQGV
jgi:hypothetical protein